MEITKALQPHQQRVVDEKAELDDKREKLKRFFNGQAFAALSSAEQSRLLSQYGIMAHYSAILDLRISAFRP